MRTEKYNVVLSGEVLDGMDLGHVKEGFKSKFKLKSDQVDQMFEGDSRVLKKNLDHRSAYHYKRAINALGAEVDIRRVMNAITEDNKLSLVERPEDSPPQFSTTSQSQSATIRCKNCGAAQRKSLSCLCCGESLCEAAVANRVASIRPGAITPQVENEENHNSRVWNFISYACYGFGFVDISLYMLDVADLTGVTWSPYVAFGFGYLASLVKKK